MGNLGNILLVEDDELDADMTIRVLKNIPLANPVIWLETGQDLLDYLDGAEEEVISLVILDLKMPMMSGLEALEEIRKRGDRFAHLPIVILSSSQDRPEIRRCYELGIKGFVTKPVGQSEFQEAVRTLGLFWGLFNVLPE